MNNQLIRFSTSFEKAIETINILVPYILDNTIKNIQTEKQNDSYKIKININPGREYFEVSQALK